MRASEAAIVDFPSPGPLLVIIRVRCPFETSLATADENTLKASSPWDFMRTRFWPPAGASGAGLCPLDEAGPAPCPLDCGEGCPSPFDFTEARTRPFDFIDFRPCPFDRIGVASWSFGFIGESPLG